MCDRRVAFFGRDHSGGRSDRKDISGTHKIDVYSHVDAEYEASVYYHMRRSQRSCIIRRSGENIFCRQNFRRRRMCATAQLAQDMLPFVIKLISLFAFAQFCLQIPQHAQIVLQTRLHFYYGKFVALLQCPEMRCEQVTWIHVPVMIAQLPTKIIANCQWTTIVVLTPMER